MNLTTYHAKYFAHDLTRRASGGMDRLSMSLFDAAVDLNPHQIEAALFALAIAPLQGRDPGRRSRPREDDRGWHRAVPVLGRAQAPPAGDLPGFDPQAVGTGAGGEVQSARAGARREGLPRSQTQRARRRSSAKAVLVMSHHYANSSARRAEGDRLGSGRDRRGPQAPQRLPAEQQGRPGHPLGHGGLPEAASDGDAASELAARTVRPFDPHRRAPVRRRQLLPRRSTPAPAAISTPCVSASPASASARCATRSPSTSVTPSGGRSRGPSGRPTTSTRSTRRCRASCSARTATRSRSASAT